MTLCVAPVGLCLLSFGGEAPARPISKSVNTLSVGAYSGFQLSVGPESTGHEGKIMSGKGVSLWRRKESPSPTN